MIGISPLLSLTRQIAGAFLAFVLKLFFCDVNICKYTSAVNRKIPALVF